MELYFFDRNQEYAVIERRLPHWSQPGVVCFITIRTADSIPHSVVLRWRDEKQDWLRQHSINPIAADWKQQLAKLSWSDQEEFSRRFSQSWHEELDACHGSCVLRDPELARIVGDSLLHANGDKYEVTDFIVMPNHVHLLAVFQNDTSMLKQVTSWKQFTATKLNRSTGGRGRFWQQDGFDHLVRSEEQYRHFQHYIANNPQKSGLRNGNYLYWQSSRHAPS